jgi:Fis family transcriptional regulator
MKETHHVRKGPLASCVKGAIERYFHDLDGERPAGDLYAIVVREVERPLLEIVMKRVQGNQCKAAEMLGINRNTLRKKLKLHGLDK